MENGFVGLDIERTDHRMVPANSVLRQRGFLRLAGRRRVHAGSDQDLLFAIISEVTTIVISLASRRPVGRDWQPLTVAATLYAGCLFPFFIDVNSGSRIISESFAATFQIIGLLWTIHAKVSLGRSFGWLPADRGVVETGAYAFVRHPIYLGYLISQVGFLLANLSIQNMLVYVLNLVAQLYRISREEKYLLQNEAYRNYAKRVRFKLIYGVF